MPESPYESRSFLRRAGFAHPRCRKMFPSPWCHIGYRPILWHVMKYYAHFGHKDFILCLGHRAEVVKNYFLNYNECASNDFVLSGGGKKLDLLQQRYP